MDKRLTQLLELAVKQNHALEGLVAPAVIEESGSAKATSDRLAQIRGTTGLKAVPVPGSPWHILAVYPSWVEPWRVSSGEAPPMPLRAVAQASDGLVSALKDWDSFGEGDPVFTQAKRLMSAWEAYEAEARPAAGEVLVHDSTRDGAAADGAAAVTSSRATRKVYPRIPRPGLESKVWMGGSFVGQFCDPFIEDSELEGNNPCTSMLEIAACLRDAATLAREQGLRVSPARMEDAAAHLAEAPTFAAGSVAQQVARLRTRLLGMSAGEYIMVPTGWSAGESSSHATMTHWYKREDGAFDLIHVNTGGGINYHPNSDNGRCKCALRFPAIPAERITSPENLWLLFELMATSAPTHNAPMLYEVAIQNIIGKSIRISTAEGFDPGHSGEQGDWMKPQRAGTCYFKCVAASLRYYLRFRGASREEMKRVMLYTRLAFVRRARVAVERLGGCRRELGPAALSPSDVLVLRIGVHQMSHHTLKAVRRGYLTVDEARRIEEVLREIDEELIPSCVTDAWVDQGPAPMQCFGDGSADGGAKGATTVWRPCAVGSSAAALCGAPDLEALAGMDVPATAQSVLDFCTGLPASPADIKTPADLLEALEALDARVTEVSSGAGGVTPSAAKQLAAELMSSVLCRHVPVGADLKRLMLGTADGASVPVGKAAFGGGRLSASRAASLAKKAHSMMLLALDLWRVAPRTDVQGVGSRNLAALACVCIFDAALRYAPPSDRADETSAITKLMRGTVPDKVSSMMPAGGHGAGARPLLMPHVLPFRTAAGVSLEEVTARFEAAAPWMGEARRLLCEYVDTVRTDAAMAVVGAGASEHQVRAAAANLPELLTPDWSTADEDYSAAGAEDMPMLEQTEAVVRMVDEPLVSDRILAIAKGQLRNDRLTKATVPVLFIRTHLISEAEPATRSCREFAAALSTCLTLQAMLEPHDELTILPAIDGIGRCTSIVQITNVSPDLDKARLTFNICGAGFAQEARVLQRGLRLSHCDVRAHGVTSRAGGAAASGADEDDVMLATRLDSFEDALTPEDAERLLAALTTATLRVPLSIAFFADSRVGALFSADLRQVLWTAVFELRDVGSEPGSHGEPLSVTTAPVTSTAQLATPRGPLWYELRHSPAATVGPLCDLIEATARLCGAGGGNIFFVTLLFVTRLAARIAQAAAAVAEDAGGRGGIPSRHTRAHHPSLDAERSRLQLAVKEHLLPALARHEVIAERKSLQDRIVAIAAHRVLLSLGLLEAEETAETVGDVIGGVALVRVYHSFGVQGRQAFTLSKWRRLVPRSSADVRGGSKPAGEVGIEAPWLSADGGLRMSEADLADVVQSKRARHLAWFEAASPEDRSRALTVALRLVQRNTSADWDRDETEPCGSRAEDDLRGGVFQGGGGGRFLIMVQTCELRTTSGTSVQPVPEQFLRSPFFSAFFGNSVTPYCTITSERQARTTLSILSSPALDGFGELQVSLWRDPGSDESRSTTSGRSAEHAAMADGGDRSSADSRGVWRSLMEAGYPVPERSGAMWFLVPWSITVASRGTVNPGALPPPLDWVARVLDGCLLEELREVAAGCKAKSKFQQPFPEDIKHRALRAAGALSTMSILAKADAASADDASPSDTATLLWIEKTTGLAREVVVHRSTCTDSAGTGGEGWVELFLLQEYCRRVYRVPVYSSDARRSAAAGTSGPLEMRAVPYAMNSAPPAERNFRSGDATIEHRSFDSIEVTRRRREPTAATVGLPPGHEAVASEPQVESVQVPAYFLRGVVPSALLDLPLLWWRRDLEDGSCVISGEPVPPAAASATSEVAGDAGMEDEADGTGSGAEASSAARVVVMVRTVSGGLGPHAGSLAAAGDPAMGVQITQHPLYPGMRDPGILGAAARAVFGADHAVAYGEQPPPSPALLLHDFVCLPPGSTMARLRDATVRAESASHALPWTHLSPAAAACAAAGELAVAPGTVVELWGVALPRLETSLEARRTDLSPEGVRFFVSDRAGLFLNDDPAAVMGWDTDRNEDPPRPVLPGADETSVGITPGALLSGLPHSLLLRGEDGSSHVLVPSHPILRPFVLDGPFSTYVCQDRGSLSWHRHARARTFLFSVSVSEGFLRVPSLAAALYLVECLVAHRQLARAARVLRSVDTDKPLTSEERFLLNALGRFGGDKTPDMHSIRCLVSLSLRYVRGLQLPWTVSDALRSADNLRDHVRSVCRLSHDQVASLREMAGDAEGAAAERKYLVGMPPEPTTSGAVSGCGPARHGLFGYFNSAEDCMAAYASAPEPTEDQYRYGFRSNSHYDFSTYHQPPPSDDLRGEQAEQYLRDLAVTGWNQAAGHLIRLATGHQRVDLIGDGSNIGRAIAHIMAQCVLMKLFDMAPRPLGNSQAFAFVVAFSASQVNADGSMRVGGEPSGFPSCPTTGGSTRTPEWVRHVKTMAIAVKEALNASGAKARIAFSMSAPGLPAWAVEPWPGRVDVPQPPPVPDTTPTAPLTLRATPSASGAGGPRTTPAAAIHAAAVKTALGVADRASVAHAAAALDPGDVAAFGTRPLLHVLAATAAECGDGIVSLLSAEERGVALPAAGLPFDAAPAGGESMPSSFIADSMCKRLQASCNDYRARVETTLEPQLRCFVSARGGRRGVVTAEELGDARTLARARMDLQTLLKHLRQLYQDEVDAVRAGVPAVLAMVNALDASQAAHGALRSARRADALAGASSAGGVAPDVEMSPAVRGERSTEGFVMTSLERLAGTRAPISDEMLLAALLSASKEGNLTAANPMLTRERARAAVDAAGALMLRANRASYASLCVGQTQGLLADLSKVSAAGRTPGQTQYGQLVRAGAALATLITSRRHYASVQGATGPGAGDSEDSLSSTATAEEALMDPRFLVFEFLNGWLLRREQVTIVTQFVREMGVDVLGLPSDVDADTMPGSTATGGGAPAVAEEDEDGIVTVAPGMVLEIGDLDDDGPDLVDAAGSGPPGAGIRGPVKSRITQARMGMGKTACVSPLCCLFMANGRSVVAQVVPSALLAQTQSLLSETFAQVIPKRVVTLDFDRSCADDPEALQALLAKIEATGRDRGVLITTASALKSMELLFVEQLSKAFCTDGVRRVRRTPKSCERHMEAAKIMGKTLQLFGKQGQGRLLLDEVDMLFDPLRSELNYPISDTVLIGPRPERWSFPVALVSVVQAATAAASGRDDAAAGPAASAAAREEDAEEDVGPVAALTAAVIDGVRRRALQVTPHLVLLEKAFYDKNLAPAVAEWAAWWLLGPGQIAQGAASRPAPSALAKAVLCRGPRDAAIVSACSGLKPRDRKVVSLARSWVRSLLPHALTKISRVSFGLLTGRHAVEGGPGSSRTRLLTSVPFVGLDVPSPVSEHAHPDVLIGLTALAFAYEGLQPRHLAEVGRDLRRAMSKQAGAFSERPARRLWSSWTAAALRNWVSKYGAVADAVVSQRREGRVPTATSTGAPDSGCFREAAMGPPDVPPLELLQLEDADQARDVHRLLGGHSPAARWFLNTTVFPAVCKHREAKLSASGQELGTDILFDGRCGFSGTPNDLIPLELGQCDFEPGSEGQFLSTLNDPTVVDVDTALASAMMFPDPRTGADTWSVRALLTAFAKADPPYHALIDCGALITGLSNELTSRFLLQEGLETMDGVVYLDDSNQKMVIMRGRAEPVPLAECGLAKGRRVTLYDQSHTTGTDLKQDPAARALLTVGKDNTLRDVFQAAWRMRGIGKGQTISFLITPEVETLVRRCRGEAAFAAEDRTRGLFGWLLRNSIRGEGLKFSQLCSQDLQHTFRRGAFRDLQIIVDGADRAEASDPRIVMSIEAPQSREDPQALMDGMEAALRVFRDGVSFEVPDPGADADEEVGKAGATRTAELLMKRYARWVKPSTRARLDSIVKRSKGDGAASAEASADVAEGLSSEMVQEQEQEVEAEQEEDAEREAELAQWFGAPDVRIPAPSPWSIAALSTASSHGALASAVVGSYPLSTWKPSRSGPSPRGLSALVGASVNWCPADLSDEPEHRVKLAAAVLTVGTPPPEDGPAGVLLSLAEAEAVRRAFHCGLVSAAASGGSSLPSPALWVVGGSDVTLLDDASRSSSSSALTTLPEQSIVAAAALFVNNEVWVDECRTRALLRGLSGMLPEQRQELFEQVLLRRRERRRAWQITSMRDVFSLQDVSQVERRDKLLAELLTALAICPRPLSELFAGADSEASGRLGPPQVEALARAVGVSVPKADARAVCSGLAAGSSGGTSFAVSMQDLAAAVQARADKMDPSEVPAIRRKAVHVVPPADSGAGKPAASAARPSNQPARPSGGGGCCVVM